jgi:Fe-S-cluster formation regulator IscX/YfhJ
MKIRPVGAEMFPADKQTNRKTDMKKVIVAFRNFAKQPNKTAVLHKICGM